MKSFGNNTTIVFFGTGPVAAKSLQLLLAHQTVEAVVTKPKPVSHRGSFPVHDVSLSAKLPIIEVSSKNDLDAKLQSSNLQSQLGVLIDFGILVSKKVIDYFDFGIINSHFSRLPEWRGADPITFSILSGQKTTAVSLMLLDEGMDTGKLLVQKGQTISPNHTTKSLTDKLIKLSDSLLRETIPTYVNGLVSPRRQPHQERATYSRKLTKEDGRIDWTKSAKQLEREIRAYAGWPKSYTQLANKDVVITAADISTFSGEPGEIIIDDKELHICCQEKSLQILTLKPAGKKEMTAEAFLAGHKNLLNK